MLSVNVSIPSYFCEEFCYLLMETALFLKIILDNMAIFHNTDTDNP